LGWDRKSRRGKRRWMEMGIGVVSMTADEGPSLMVAEEKV